MSLQQLMHVLSAIGGFVSLDGEIMAASNPGGVANSGPIFNTDGSIDEVGPALTDLVQRDPGTWWSDEPETAIGSSYDVRCQSLNVGTWSFQAATVGTYIQMSVDRRWTTRVIAMEAPAQKLCNANFQISLTGLATALATAIYQGDATN